MRALSSAGDEMAAGRHTMPEIGFLKGDKDKFLTHRNRLITDTSGKLSAQHRLFVKVLERFAVDQPMKDYAAHEREQLGNVLVVTSFSNSRRFE